MDLTPEDIIESHRRDKEFFDSIPTGKLKFKRKGRRRRVDPSDALPLPVRKPGSTSY